MPPEILSALPDKVQIPKAGREVGLKTPYPQGTVGRKVMFKVNHFSIETLPIIQVTRPEDVYGATCLQP
jgi:hypothetical protein